MSYVPHPHNFHGHMFQARMWRTYAAAWTVERRLKWADSRVGTQYFFPPDTMEWADRILKVSRDECVRRARLHLAAAKAKNIRSRNP